MKLFGKRSSRNNWHRFLTGQMLSTVSKHLRKQLKEDRSQP